MRMYDLIEKKKTGHTLTTAEINYMILGYTRMARSLITRCLP